MNLVDEHYFKHGESKYIVTWGEDSTTDLKISKSGTNNNNKTVTNQIDSKNTVNMSYDITLLCDLFLH